MASQVVIDPATYDTTSLPSGMSIDSINGVKYFKVIVIGWYSVIPVADLKVTGAYSHFKTTAKLSLGATDSFTLADVNTFLKLANFRANPQVEIGAAGNASSANITNYQIAIAKKDTITGVQVATQENFSPWSSLVGDTLWIGKVLLVDLIKPTAPGSLSAVVDGSTVNLSWTASTDNAAVAGYIVTQDGVKIDTVTTLTKSVSGLADGIYAFGVTAIDSSGNKSTTSTVNANVGSVGVNKPSSIVSLNLSPNPVNDFLNIDSQDAIKAVSITNLAGQTLFNSNYYNSSNVRLNLSSLQSGLYLVKVQTANGTQVQRIIKR